MDRPVPDLPIPKGWKAELTLDRWLRAGLYLFVLKRMQLQESIQIKVALYFTLFCGFGFALFLPFRCITSLLVPTLFGYHGRTYVQTYLVTYVLQGHLAELFFSVWDW